MRAKMVQSRQRMTYRVFCELCEFCERTGRGQKDLKAHRELGRFSIGHLSTIAVGCICVYSFERFFSPRRSQRMSLHWHTTAVTIAIRAAFTAVRFNKSDAGSEIRVFGRFLTHFGRFWALLDRVFRAVYSSSNPNALKFNTRAFSLTVRTV
jgi:hypothetical protein